MLKFYVPPHLDLNRTKLPFYTGLENSVMSQREGKSTCRSVSYVYLLAVRFTFSCHVFLVTRKTPPQVFILAGVGDGR